MSEELRQQNMEIVRAYIDALNGWDFDAIEQLLDEAIRFEMPYAPAGFERTIVGRDELISFQKTLPPMIETENLHDLDLQTYHSDPGEIVAEYKSDMLLRPMNTVYRNEYVARFTVRDGKITRFAEYYDPIRLVVAMGGTVETAALP